MIGYRLLDTYQVDVRFAMGPSYDVLLSVDDRNDRIGFGEADMRKGSLNWDVALGFDLGYFTIDAKSPASA